MVPLPLKTVYLTRGCDFMEEVILVDLQDNPIGVGEKLQVHLEGQLHRALSVFLFNSKGEMLLQQRAFEKYHSGGLWTNACCSHPRPGEVVLDAAKRRLQEEMGIATELVRAFEFVYQAKLDHGLTEYEFDHVFYGIFNGSPKLNPEEACDWRWANLTDLKGEIEKSPERFTYWFKKIIADSFQDLLNKSNVSVFG